MEREGLSILECLGRPVSKNSVLEGLNIRFADILEDTSAIAFSRKETISYNDGGQHLVAMDD
jgi:hypothetical protein